MNFWAAIHSSQSVETPQTDNALDVSWYSFVNEQEKTATTSLSKVTLRAERLVLNWQSISGILLRAHHISKVLIGSKSKTFW